MFKAPSRRWSFCEPLPKSRIAWHLTRAMLFATPLALARQKWPKPDLPDLTADQTELIWTQAKGQVVRCDLSVGCFERHIVGLAAVAQALP